MKFDKSRDITCNEFNYKSIMLKHNTYTMENFSFNYYNKHVKVSIEYIQRDIIFHGLEMFKKCLYNVRKKLSRETA